MITIRELLANVIAGKTSIVGMSTVALLSVPLNGLLIEPATADFTPPKVDPAGTRQGAATRGCDASETTSVALMLLAPNQHVGLVASGHPTFYWYISPSASVPITFTLVEPKVAKPLFVKELQVKKAGIVQLELPNNMPELVPGREYRWTVSVQCDPERPSTNIIAKALVQRVSLTPQQSSKLATVTSLRDRALIYTDSGFWYDALTSLVKAYQAQPTNQSILADINSLTNQVGLTDLTATSWKALQVQ